MKNQLIGESLMRRSENHEVYFLYRPLGILAPHGKLLKLEACDYEKWLTGVGNIDLTFAMKLVDFSSFLEAASIAVPRSRSIFR